MNFVQRDLGTAAEASSGGGARGTLAEFSQLILLSAAAIGIIGLFFLLAAEIAVLLVTPEQESLWLQEITARIPADDPGEPELKAKMDLLRGALERLAAQPGVPEMDYRLLWIDDPEPNAFAFPGGAIGVTRGLLEALDEEIGFAFVLAHELGHFKHRDHLRGVIRDAGRGVAVGLIFGGSGAAISERADQWLALSYSRRQEHAADRFGLELVHAAYGRAEGTEALFRVLAAKDQTPSWAYMFTTHPDTRGRLARLQAFAAELDRAAAAEDPSPEG